jgi:IS30 family transposase
MAQGQSERKVAREGAASWKPYRHLIQEERYQISALHEAGWLQVAIAARLGRAASAISRELNRNRVVGPYQPQVAGLLAVRAASSKRLMTKKTHSPSTD